MARDANGQLNRCGAFDDDGFWDLPDRLLRAAEVGKLPRGVQPLAKQVLDVRSDVGLAPGDMPVASDGDGWRARKRGADDVEVAAGDVR